MKLFLKTDGKQFQVCKAPEAKTDQNGNQKTAPKTKELLWITQVFVLDAEGGEVINVTTAGSEMPKVAMGDQVNPIDLEAVPWNTDKGRSGTMYRCTELAKVKAAAPAAK